MFQRILNKISWDYNQKQVNKTLPLVKKINELDTLYMSLTDDQIKAKTPEFKERIKTGETLEEILPEAFAVVKQACRRMCGQSFEVKWSMVAWNMIPYDSQLIGGIILHQGKIAEMKTWEGKTLVASLPVYLNALTGKGVHVVTVNDYLASRDAQRIGYLYERLGLTIGSVIKSTWLNVRREQYSKDITYVENAELGFDYLRDNLTKTLDNRNMLWRSLNFAIVDEIDSICIDEARTPLIISEPSEEATDKYGYYANLITYLTPCKGKKKISKGFLKELLADEQNSKNEEIDNGDYYIDEKTKSALLSSQGIKKLETMLKVNNLYKDLGYSEIHHIENALKANAVYHKDKDYIIVNGEILIIDEHTGRAMPGRRYSEGLHQAIEAKEQVQVQRESRTLATITYQNFFKIYPKIAGMTGTATTEGEEFEKIYGLEVLAIPTHRTVIRVDKNDKVYFNQKAKRSFVLENIMFYHEMGQPILIGTSAIHTSEYVSDLLRKKGVQHYVLNAKFHEQEAHIIENAGKLKSVVVATNMAGRGTDIKLAPDLNITIASNYASWIAKTLQGDEFKNLEPQEISAVLYSEFEYNLVIEALKKQFSLNDEDIRQAEQKTLTTSQASFTITFNKKKKLASDAFVEIIFKPLSGAANRIEKDFHFGLFILGTEKHESRRIDNQLRGRAGRQGDPGISVFFVGLDDEIMRKMGGEKIQSVASLLMKKEELEVLELTQSQFTSSIVRAQKQMEWWNFSIRKHLFDYDSVINRQRQRMYAKRDEILHSEKESSKILEEVEQFSNDIAKKLATNYQTLGLPESEFLDTLMKDFNLQLDQATWDNVKHPSQLETYLNSSFKKYLIVWIESMGEEEFKESLKNLYLNIIDKYRVEHIDTMQYLREKVGLYGYAQMDPLIIYKTEAFEKFETLLYSIKYETLATLSKVDFSQVQNISWTDQSPEYLNQLKDLPTQQPQFSPQALSQRQKAMIFSSDDGVEVFQANTSELSKKYGRNDLVTLIKGDEEQTLKWKKAEELLTQGRSIKS